MFPPSFLTKQHMATYCVGKKIRVGFEHGSSLYFHFAALPSEQSWSQSHTVIRYNQMNVYIL